MKTMFKKFSFWAIVISFIIALLIIFVSPYLSDSFKSLSFRLFLATSLFFTALTIVLLVILFKKEETKNKLKEKEKEIKYYRLIQQKKKLIKIKFKEALRIIKKSSLYKNRTKIKYELPWYLIFGDSNSGKTSLIRNSGLELPLNIENSQTNNEDDESNFFTWFYTENSIFIDIKGSLLYQETNSENAILWREFLKIFRKKRWERPINGIVLTIPADTILSLQNERLEAYVKNLRDRFDEISSNFLSTIPIYLIITKSDNIDGFKEYFSLLKENEKDEVLGVTFNSEDSQISRETIKPYFENLLKRLNNSVIERVHFEWEEKNRWKIFSFCNNFCEILERVDDFISKCFSNTRYRTPLLIRGVYFTTALDNEYIKQIEEQSTLEDKSINSQKKGMFIKKLFTDIVFSEADMIKLDEKHEKRMTKKHYSLSVAAALFLIFLGSFIVSDFIQQNSALNDMTKEYEIYKKTKENLLSDGNYNNIVEILNLIEQIETINKTQMSDNFWNVSFFKFNDRANKLQNIYHTDLIKLLLSEVANSIEQNIKTKLEDFDTTWDNTKAYLMLQNFEKRDNPYLLAYMARYWNEKYQGMPKFQEDLNRHWNNALKFGFGSYDINQDILRLARDRLSEFDQTQIAYKVIKNDGLNMNIKEFSFIKTISNNSNFFNNDNFVIPGLFTKEGFAVMMTKGLELTAKAFKNNWIIEERANLSALEIEDYYKKILAYYLQDYKDYWNEALSKLQINPANNILDLNDQLSLMTSPNSPILDVLKAVKENTQIYTPMEIAAQTPLLPTQNEGESKVTEVATKTINNQLDFNDILSFRAFFKPYNDLLDENYQPSNILKKANDRISNTNQIMTTIKEAINPNEDAFNIVRNRVQGQEKSMLSSLDKLPIYTKNWYKDILQSNWKYILNRSKIYVDERYKEEVYAFYNSRIKSKYPFTKTDNYLNLDDFEEFFQNDGVLDKFYKDYLFIFLTINKNNFEIRYRNLDGNTLKISKNTENSLKIAYKIKRAFFKNDGRLGLEASIKPFRLSNNLATVNLEYGDSSLFYEHGPIISRKLSWPPQKSNILKFKLFDLNNNLVEERFINSEWALFELLNSLDIKRHNNNENSYIYLKDKYEASFLIEGYLNDMLDKKDGLFKFILNENI